MPHKILRIAAPGSDYEIRVIGARRSSLRDFYHLLLRLRWYAVFAILALIFLLANALFACGYLVTGGLANAQPGSFADAFFFSVQTMGTIGYGAITPLSRAANVLVVAESITGLILTALATGLVFAKFSRPTARVVFTHDVVIAPVDGVDTLSFRLGNERANQLIDAHIRLVMTHTERRADGSTFYRTLDLPLVRDRALTLQRSFVVMHRIDEQSPLAGLTPERIVEDEVELLALVTGTDDTAMMPVHAIHHWFPDHIRWGMRHVDVLTELDRSTLVLDLRKFHAIEPAA